MAEIVGHFVTLPDGLRHYYAEAGEGTGAIVFLHGFTDSWRSFEALFGELSQGFRLLALDQRGHGQSEAAARYAIADFTEDAIRFIETVAEGPVHLVGHSLGSIVAQRVAAARPELIRSLTVIGAAPQATDHPGLLAFQAELDALEGPISAEFAEAFQNSTTYEPLPADRLAIFVAESLKLHPATWRGALQGLVSEPAPPAGTGFSGPTLSLWGIEDGVFGAADQQALAAALPALTAVHYPATGHAPHWEKPDLVAQDILAFLSSVDQTYPDRATEEAHHGE